MNGVDFFIARAVVDRIVTTSKKNWNIDIVALPSFEALPTEVKQAAINDYGNENGNLFYKIAHSIAKVLAGKAEKAHVLPRSEAEGREPHPVTTGVKSRLPRVYTPDHDLNLPLQR